MLRRCAFAERLHCLFLAVENFENRQQLGHLQQVTHSLGEPRQFDGSVSVPCGRIKRNQRSQSAAIDVAHVSQVQNDARVP